MSERIITIPKLELIGVSPEKTRITETTTGFSSVLTPAGREQFNQPYGLALIVKDLGFGRIAVAYRPAEKSFHRPQDAIGFRTEAGAVTVTKADGATNMSDGVKIYSETQSHLYAHQLVSHLEPILSQGQAAHWLNSLPATPGLENAPVYAGASTLTSFTITEEDGGYRLHFCQLGEKHGARPGETFIINPRGKIIRLEVDRDVPIYHGKRDYGYLPSWQEIALKPGSLVVSATDGYDSLSLLAALRKRPGQELEKIAQELLKTPNIDTNSLFRKLLTLSPDNGDDGSLALIWLK